MKAKIIISISFLLFFAGCTIPCDIFFRNLSDETVLLKGKLANRWHFEKLPNKVDFYDTTQKPKLLYGEWKYQRLVTWTDSVNFQIEIPPNSIIDVSDVSQGLTPGAQSPDVLLTVFSDTKADTLTTGDYHSLAAKFKLKRRLFSKPACYYDMK